MKRPLKNTNSVDLSEYNTVFCDSLQALEWAYENGLPKSAIIKSSAPAMLWDKNPKIQNIEARWTVDELEKFQSTILKMTEDIFDVALNISEVERELALAVSRASYQFQRILYKSACLEEGDFVDSRLFIYVDGKTGPAGNMMNSPWEKFLSINPLFSTVNYILKDDNWKVLSTQGVSYWRRFQVAGYETIIYRLATKIMKKIPNWIFTKEILMPNENELNIEIASSLALRGIKVSKIQLQSPSNTENVVSYENTTEIYSVILPIMRKRVEQWVTPSAVEVTMSLFESYLKKQIKQFKLLVNGWEQTIVKNDTIKQSVLVNAPGNLKGQALAYVCRKNNIPLISSQHGVTIEISKAHNMLHVAFDNSVINAMFSYNSAIIDIEKNTYFDNSKHYVVGMPLRLIRMKYEQTLKEYTTPIVYISANLYHMGFSTSQKTDYINARDEQNIVAKVLSKLPHKVCYKTYPEDNRRYADTDPVFNEVESANNMELFSVKIDMRYLIPKHQVFVTTCATSTLGWPVMSGKPVVFIDQKNNNPLTDDAFSSLAKGLFVFSDDEHNFHKKLRDFLSQPIEEIERLWKEKKSAREEMIKEYFSAYKNGGAGKRAAKIIIREYL
jgi:hypothetical protein